MLRQSLTLIPEQEANIVANDLQDSNEIMTNLMRQLAYHNFKTIDTDPSRWAMQGRLVKIGEQPAHKLQVFLNIGGVNNVFIQVEIVRTPENPLILVNGNFNAKEALEMIRRLPYFHEEEY